MVASGDTVSTAGQKIRIRYKVRMLPVECINPSVCTFANSAEIFAVFVDVSAAAGLQQVGDAGAERRGQSSSLSRTLLQISALHDTARRHYSQQEVL